MKANIFSITLVCLVGCGYIENPNLVDDDLGTEATANPEVGTSTDDFAESNESTSSTTDTTTMSESSSSDTSSMFLPVEDIPGANACNIWLQDCPEGEKCAAYAMGDTWDSTKCVPLLGDAVEGDQCSYDGAVAGTDTCDLGYFCHYTNMDGVGTCIPLCSGSADNPVCPQGFDCSISNNGSLILCLYDCHPILQDCEPVGTGCFWDGELFTCNYGGDIPTNEPCSQINDCLPGHVCVDASVLPGCNDSACCSAFCDLTNPICSIMETQCVSFFDEGTAPAGLENVGLCIMP